MRNFILSLLRALKHPDLPRSGVFLRSIGFLLVLFQFQTTYAQEALQEISQVPMLYVAEGAEIFSADKSFNKSVAEDKLRIKGAEISVRIEDGRQQLIVSHRINKEEYQSPDLQGKEIQQLKKEKAPASVRKAIAANEKRKADFRPAEVAVPISSDHLFKAQKGIGNYCVPGSNYQFSEAQMVHHVYGVSRALDYLYSKTCTFYSSICVDYCFTTIFSVRPPPSLTV